MDVLQELDKAGAVLLDRHFVYKSGKHGPGYINMDPLLSNVVLVSLLCGLLGKPFAGEFDTVASPATGGVVLAFATACQTVGKQPSAVWADKVGDEFDFERAGFVNHLKDRRVLVVEDLLTTGGSALKVCREAKKHGAEVIGLSVICNRGGITAEQLEVPRLEALASINFEAVDPDACELCKNGAPIVEDIGHGAKYKANHPEYKGGYIRLL